MTCNNPRKVAIMAGEASGDAHGARVAAALRIREPDVELYGMGAGLMRQAGVELTVNSKDLAVIGITAVLAKLPEYFRALGQLKKMLRTVKPDLLILIDFPDFNMLLARYAKKFDIPVLYYISPQIWAWRRGRVKKIVKYVKHMAVILPFEEQFYQSCHMPVTYVGHPLMEREFPTAEQVWAKRPAEHPVIGILPGSRNGEIRRLLDIMLKSAAEIQRRRPDVTFLLSKAPSVDSALFDEIVRQNAEVRLEIVPAIRELFGRVDALIAASGTVTLEAGLHGLPMCIIYRVSRLNYIVGRALLKVKWIGLVNLVADEGLMPELIQDEAQPAKIADEILDMLQNETRYNHIKATLIKVKQRLGQGLALDGASAKVADIAEELMNESPERDS